MFTSRTCTGAMLAFCGIVLTSIPALARDYLLGPQDKLSIKVYEVRTSTGEIFAWEPLNGEFTISASGEISLPLLGNIGAAGKTAPELSKAISDEMKARIGLVSPPIVALEIAEYRPFFMVGDVDKPGAYPFRPDLTVLQAFGIAGGLPAIEDLGTLRLRRDVLTQEGELRQLTAERYALLARRARLLAELEQAAEIIWPAELQRLRETESIAKIIEQETKIFDARRNALENQISALNNLKGSLDGEIKSLEGQLIAKQREEEVVARDLQNISGLVEKGLAASPRRTGLERTIAELEGERLQLQTALLKARQELGRTDILIVEVRNASSKDVTATLRETEVKLDDVTERQRTAQQVLRETIPLAPGALTSLDQGKNASPQFTILRMVSGEIKQLSATEQTFVEPGDTIKVVAPAGFIEAAPREISQNN